jgi:D-beta-D-heptose 7-phosphate kinase/D-beta-D-heptose 1-phosphate adenosyltransferase
MPTKILSRTALKRKVNELKNAGKRVVFTNGCFDIIHYGHVKYLEAAKRKGSVLIIGMNSDASIRRIKGSSRPIVTEKERAYVLASLECVDYVTIFDEDTPQKLIAALLPDILVKGADWKGKEVAGSDVIKANGGKVQFISYVPGCSTTNIIERILKSCKKR